MFTCKKVYPWAWNLVEKSTPEEIELMRIKNSVERERLKEEVMSHIVSQCEGFISNEDQEEAADLILDELEKTA